MILELMENDKSRSYQKLSGIMRHGDVLEHVFWDRYL